MGGLGYSIEVTASMVAGDMTAAQLLGISVFISRIYANYSTTDQGLAESVTGNGPVTYPYITTFASLSILVPFGLKHWVFLFGKGLAPAVHNPSTYALVAGTAATVAFVSYYLGNGLSWGEVTRSDAAAAAQADASRDAGDSAATAQGAADPRRTESGFDFPGKSTDPSAHDEPSESSDNPVADHPAARQSHEERD